MVPTFTYTRGGDAGGEGTWKLYSVDLSRYDASKRPSIDLNTGRLVGNPMQALTPLGLICDPCDGIPRGMSLRQRTCLRRESVSRTTSLAMPRWHSAPGSASSTNDSARTTSTSARADRGPTLRQRRDQRQRIQHRHERHARSDSGNHTARKDDLAHGQHDTERLFVVHRHPEGVAVQILARRLLCRQSLAYT